ncbi:glucosaminidase domain-containing protein [Sneathiella sp.]|uniref:glucosaminidase domain-containing protein n=1 Tax=Sneathiella sp. TaxID=1964365 RepID=UPI00356B2EAE
MMQILKSWAKSNRLVTLLAVLLAFVYVFPAFMEHGAKIEKVTGSIGKAILAKANLGTDRKAVRQSSIDQSGRLDISSLHQALSELDYSLQNIRDGQPVPRFFVEKMPIGIVDITDVGDRKRTFLKLVLPLILNSNEKIQARRDHLVALNTAQKSGKAPSAADQKWLAGVAEYYRESPTDLPALLAKVDAIPVSMALAQAVEESGWGTSRFALEGNALFGQRVWSSGDANSGEGIIPEERDNGETHEVKAFNTLADSVKDYIHNLNVHDAYADFRKERAELRAEPGARLDGLRLAETLTPYSEGGSNYIENLRTLIEANRLDDFESAILAPEQFADSRF